MIASAARSMSYSTRWKVAVQASVSSSSQAARGSPSRGWPTLPGLISQRPCERSRTGPGAGLGAAGVVVVAVLGHGEVERDVGVADERDPARLGADALRRLVGPEDVLPDRVAGRGVVERDLGLLVGGLERARGTASSPARAAPGSSGRRPRRRARTSRCRARRGPRGRGCRPACGRSCARPARRSGSARRRSRRRRRGTSSRRRRPPRRPRAPPRARAGWRGCPRGSRVASIWQRRRATIVGADGLPGAIRRGPRRRDCGGDGARRRGRRVAAAPGEEPPRAGAGRRGRVLRRRRARARRGLPRRPAPARLRRARRSRARCWSPSRSAARARSAGASNGSASGRCSAPRRPAPRSPLLTTRGDAADLDRRPRARGRRRALDPEPLLVGLGRRPLGRDHGADHRRRVPCC